MIRVWDPVVRFFHWGLAACFALAWLTAEEVQGAHEWLGYAAAALVALRVVWGLTGSHYARFAQFVRGPGAVAAYLRDMATGRERRYVGHNPAGAAMIVALLLSMAGTAWTGWLMAEPERQVLLPAIVAPAFADEDGEGEHGEGRGDGAVEEVHEALANLMLVLVVLHLGGVALASMRHRENLARSMVTGLKRPAEPGDVA
ncbi:cytochrome b/b6 domain-containing protein [Cereibacter sphaeroides]|uniref:cytochrome b/b6 domain-containing protein n=1 Tax=Cereibacter sphaeroides TaxID=1063 RepID=UPI001F1FA91D|nr:cytochrome b/b6 domain-containing protein [Cereibacter sphaeroides]MCE6953157.1 cytochrome b/b6 domain-containing protein [Cereibacter sphaeroides]MCE6961743.1 cytochrome b/b6 domain-containing protein [Cereibacter sphaeroides]MCE6975093.1 cytochrome b/b6 domain-containing protein [Cereibacter sphaeroides]